MRAARPPRALHRDACCGGLQFWKNTAQLIERADLPLRTGEVFYIQLGCALLFGMPAGFAGVFPLVVLGLFALGFFAPILYLKLAARKRQRAFEDQLPDTLVAMAASLKAGHSWNQAMDTVIREGSEPTPEGVRPRRERGPARAGPTTTRCRPWPGASARSTSSSS